jgi:hypothetical protein
MYLVYMAAGVLAVAVGSPSHLGLVGIVCLGALGLSSCAGIALEQADRASRLIGIGSAVAIGAGFTYGVSVLSEGLGWPALFLAWSLPGVVVADLVCAGVLLRGPLADLNKKLMKGHGSQPPSRQRAAIRVLTPLLFVASLVGAILVAAHVSSVPDVAFGNHVVFAGLLLIVFFYGALFALVPLARGLMSGQWPAELTTTGARYEKHEHAISRELTDDLAAKVKRLEVVLKESIEEAGAAADQAIDAGVQNNKKEVEDLDLRTRTTSRLVVDSLAVVRSEISALDERLRAVEP